MDRRAFLKVMGTAGAMGLIDPADFLVRRAMASGEYLGLHPFVEAHPEAVFIKRTHVPARTDAEAKKREGVELAMELFTLRDTPAIPLSHRIAMKPNIAGFPMTDPHFVEGMIEGMKEVGLSADRMYMREGNWLGDGYSPHKERTSEYDRIAERTGAHLTDFPSGRRIDQLTLTTLEEGLEVTWMDCPDGAVFRRIGYVAPYNQPDAWLLNIAKFKAHGMGLTLCCKNQQGMCVSPHIHFCEGVDQTKKHPGHILKDFQPDLEEHVEQSHAQHLEAGVPRWDKPGRSWNSGYGMEMWAQRTCDNLLATKRGLSILEGLSAEDGYFSNGPGPGGKPNVFMTNMLIFSTNPVLVDIVAHWLGGHEPGNFGLFHCAMDRGLSNVLNPMDIPVYRWANGVPIRTPLTEFERTPILTSYMQRDYGGQSEPYWHLVDEPFDYGPFTSVEVGHEAQPRSHVLGQNFPNPFNASTIIEYQIPRDGYVSLEVYNARGQRVDVLVDGWQMRGAHMASWNAGKKASGTYFYRFRTDGFENTRKMVLVR